MEWRQVKPLAPKYVILPIRLTVLNLLSWVRVHWIKRWSKFLRIIKSKDIEYWWYLTEYSAWMYPPFLPTSGAAYMWDGKGVIMYIGKKNRDNDSNDDPILVNISFKSFITMIIRREMNLTSGSISSTTAPLVKFISTCNWSRCLFKIGCWKTEDNVVG